MPVKRLNLCSVVHLKRFYFSTRVHLPPTLVTLQSGTSGGNKIRFDSRERETLRRILLPRHRRSRRREYACPNLTYIFRRNVTSITVLRADATRMDDAFRAIRKCCRINQRCVNRAIRRF